MDFCKKVKITLIFLFGLFLFSYNIVYADTYYTSYDTGLKTYANKDLYVGYEQWVLDYLSLNAPEYNNNDYYWLVFMTANNGNTGQGTGAWFLPKNEVSGKPFTIDIGNNNAPTSTNRNVTLNNVGGTLTTYWFSTNGQVSKSVDNTYNAYTTYCKWENTNNYVCYLVWSDDASSNFYLGGNLQNNVFPSSFQSPYISGFVSPNTSTNIYDETMPFNYFNIHAMDVDIDNTTMIFNIYDDTYGVSDTPIGSFFLNSDSRYFTSPTNKVFTIAYHDINGYNSVNGNKYHVFLSYYDNNNVTHTIAYWFEFSFSSTTIENIEQNTQSDINKTLENTQNYLTNDNIDSNQIVDIINGINIQITNGNLNYLDILFNTLNNIFTDENSQDFTFIFPFSNEQNSITIPADYIETHLPSAIINLIRLFYWYFISIFILKDVWRTIDNLRNGNLYAVQSEDIKEKLL